MKYVLGILVISLSLLLRSLVGLNGHSGKGVPPMYGDFEAQRHWLEITTALPIEKWYRYDPEYWPLDYPPLTAFHSFVLVEPQWVAHNTSKGLETDSLILFMRLTAIMTEFIIYIPAVTAFASIIKTMDSSKSFMNKHLFTMIVLSQPSLLLIDHGHFQYQLNNYNIEFRYNSAMLGLVLWAIVFASQKRYMESSFCFVSALCFKQMSLFYSLAFFFYFLVSRLTVRIWLLFKIAVAVVFTFGLYFSAFARSSDDLLQVFRRIFPFHRGLWEDKVANFWCSLNVLIKLRQLFSIPTLAKMSASVTLLSCLPSCLLVYKYPTQKRFLYSLLNCSLSFYLFSFQVHEKSILLPLLPATLLIFEDPEFSILFNLVGTFSMYPLLKRDECVLAYWVSVGVFAILTWHLVSRKWIKVYQMSILGMLVIHYLDAFVAPPAKYPDLWVVSNCLWSCLHFVIILIYSNYKTLIV